MADWTIQRVADRFDEAARVAQRLPPVRVQGYYNNWPAIRRMPWENLGAEPAKLRLPPSPAAIDRMIETMGWVQWLDEERRHLVWMRAQHYGWRDITHRFGCDRSTAWRRWQASLGYVAARLNVESAR